MHSTISNMHSTISYMHSTISYMHSTISNMHSTISYMHSTISLYAQYNIRYGVEFTNCQLEKWKFNDLGSRQLE